MKQKTVARATALATVLLLAACGGEQTETVSEAEPGVTETSSVIAAYVLLVPGPLGARPLARAVVDGSAAVCPTVTAAGGSPVAMQFRDNPHNFAVRVCERYVDFGVVNTVSGWATPLPVASDSPTHPVIFGDTGCKLCTEPDQGCKDHCPDDSAAEPFATLAQEAANRQPDLVLHAGDFNYRGTGGYDYQVSSPSSCSSSPGCPEYDAGDITEGDPARCQLESPYVSQNASYAGDRRDSWANWRDDLFVPGAPLMAAAPWIVTRGNHELCSRAGPGWFYFLDPSTTLEGGTQLRCPPQEGPDGAVPASADGHILLTPPRMVALKTLRVGVLDSANACDEYAPEATTSQYTTQFNTLLASTPQLPTTWALTHRPTWGVSGTASTAVTLEAALSASDANPLPAGLSLMVSGHMHQFQSVTFASGSRPPQLVVGNSGVELASPDPPGSFTQTVDGLPATGLAIAHHGFLDVTSYDSTTGAWSGAIIDKHKKTIGTCSSAAPGGSICQLKPATTP